MFYSAAMKSDQPWWGVMAKMPRRGGVKTRLAADIGGGEVGESVAADVYAAMLEWLLVQLAPADSDASVVDSAKRHGGVLLVPTEDVESMRRWTLQRGIAVDVQSQGEGDLGDRMRSVFERYLTDRDDSFVLVGSDLPSVSRADLIDARDRSRTMRRADLPAAGDGGSPVVLGPARDGGYWLIAMSGRWSDDRSALFEGIDWSTAAVYRQTVAACERIAAPVQTFDTREDIDDLASLRRWLDRHATSPLAKTIGAMIDSQGKRGVAPESTIVIGGGAIGLSIAWELSHRGQPVCVVDAGRMGGGTTSAAAGILPPARMDTATDPIERLRGYSHEMFDGWTRRLERESSVEVGYVRCGGWYIAETAGEAAAMAATVMDWHEAGIEVQSVPVDEFLRRTPHWRPVDGDPVDGDPAAVWFTPDERQIDPRRYAAAMSAVLQKSGSGVEIRERCEVVDIGVDGDHVMVQTRCDAAGSVQTIRGRRAIICGGPMAGRIAKEFGMAHSIVPIRGQMLSLQIREPADAPEPMIYNVGNRYVVVRPGGGVLVGSCEEEAGFDCRVVDSTIDSLRRFAADRMPVLREAEIIETWAGLRPMTFDGFPMIGRVPSTDHIYFAGGHYRSGIHFSPATACLMADAILGQTPAIDTSDFAVKNLVATG